MGGLYVDMEALLATSRNFKSKVFSEFPEFSECPFYYVPRFFSEFPEFSDQLFNYVPQLVFEFLCNFQDLLESASEVVPFVKMKKNSYRVIEIDLFWLGMVTAFATIIAGKFLWAVMIRCVKGRQVVVRNVQTMSQTTYLSRQRQDPVFHYQGEVVCSAEYISWRR